MKSSDPAVPGWRTVRTGARSGRPRPWLWWRWRWRRTCRNAARESQEQRRRRPMSRRRIRGEPATAARAVDGVVNGGGRLQRSRMRRRRTPRANRSYGASDCGRTVPGLQHYCCRSDRLRSASSASVGRQWSRDGGGLPLPRSPYRVRGSTLKRRRATAAASSWTKNKNKHTWWSRGSVTVTRGAARRAEYKMYSVHAGGMDIRERRRTIMILYYKWIKYYIINYNNVLPSAAAAIVGRRLWCFFVRGRHAHPAVTNGEARALPTLARVRHRRCRVFDGIQYNNNSSHTTRIIYLPIYLSIGFFFRYTPTL